MVRFGHYALLVVIFTILGWGFQKAIAHVTDDAARQRRFIARYIVFSVAWIAYVSILAGTGFLADFSLPPKMVVFVILPAFAIIAWFFTAKKFREVIHAFPEPLTVYFQSFRIIVELLIWGAVLQGMGPELLSFEGRNFDILAGLSAPVVGYLAYSRKIIGAKGILAWNIACLLLLANIVFMFLSLVVKPGIWGYTAIPISLDFPRLPYIFIAGVFMPAAVFMHVFSIRKLLYRIKTKTSV